MMNIDEAIKHAEEVAESKEKQVKNGDWKKDSLTERNCIKCAEEHRQLAEWLRELKRLRNQERPDTEWLWLGEQQDGTRWWCRNCGIHVKETTEFCPYCGGDARKIKGWWTYPPARNIRRMTEENLQDTIVGGYFIRDLIVTAERLKKEGVDPHKLRMSCDDFLEGNRPHGEWIWNTDNYYAQRRYCKCSICGVGMGDTEYDFCPNCGADMREGETE